MGKKRRIENTYVSDGNMVELAGKGWSFTIITYRFTDGIEWRVVIGETGQHFPLPFLSKPFDTFRKAQDYMTKQMVRYIKYPERFVSRFASPTPSNEK